MYVLMVVKHDFPEGDAGAVRDEAFAQIYMDMGYEVKLIGRSRGAKNGVYNDIQYTSLFYSSSGLKGHIKRLVIDPIIYNRKIMEWINEYGKPGVIHINDISTLTVNLLISIAKRNRIPILHDSVEWYSACEFKLGVFDKAYILKDILNRFVIRKPITVLAISTFLNEYFRSRGLKSYRVPVILDVKQIALNINNEKEKIRFIYAGSPANKDYLREMIFAFEKLSIEEKDRVQFDVYGASDKEIKELTGITTLSSCTIAHGRVSRDKVKSALMEADFAVLLRPAKERYAMAGFPTKSVEAMTYSTAMLCNISSDLGMYLSDMDNSIIVDGCTTSDLLAGIRKVLAIDRQDIEKIKQNARKIAEENFDYRGYIKVVSDAIAVSQC